MSMVGSLLMLPVVRMQKEFVDFFVTLFFDLFSLVIYLSPPICIKN